MNRTELDVKLKTTKDKLESLKDKQDSLMEDIEEWSIKRKQIEKETKEKKLKLETELEEALKERSSLDYNMEQSKQLLFWN